MTTPTTPRAILAGNIAAARGRRRLQQSDLADRMRELGWKWVRQTVGEVENNQRRLTAEEVFGLSVALETSISALMAPVDDDKVVEFPSGLELSVTAVQMLARGLSDIGVTWHGNKPVLNVPAEPVERFRQAFGGGDSVSLRQDQDKLKPVVAAIVTSGLGVLVGRRHDGKPPWTFIAGEQDAVQDESPADTAVREVKEETGLRVTAGEVIGERVHPKTGRTMIYLAARPTRGTDVIVGDEDELAEVRWISLAEADELLPGMFGPVREHLARELGEAGD